MTKDDVLHNVTKKEDIFRLNYSPKTVPINYSGKKKLNETTSTF